MENTTENSQQNNDQINQIPQKNIAETENPGQRLEDILKEINEAHTKENKTLENSLYREAQDLFKAFTGQDLFEKARAAAVEEIESEGSKMTPKKDSFSEENLKKEIDGFKFKQQASTIQKSWLLLSDAEKKQYLNDTGLFISAIEKKIRELSKAGIDISKEVFCNLMANGYMLVNYKRSIFTGKILIPVLLGAGAYKYKATSIKEFGDFATMMQSLSDLIARQAVEDELNKKLFYTKKRWHKRKMRKIREIIKAAAKTMESQQLQEAERAEIRKRLEEQIKEKIQKEVEAEERASLEKLSNIGEVGVLERLQEFEHLEKKTDRNIKKEIEKIEKGLEKDIQERTADEKKISNIMKKQMEKGRISKKRTSYLSKVVEEEKEAPEE